MKILLLDIETAPNVVYTWGLYEQNIAINQIVSTGYVLCFAAKWLGDSELMFHSVRTGARSMLRRAHSLLNECDAVVHYNGRKFDIPTLNKEFLVNAMLPPSPYKQVDLYRVAKSEFRFASNKLDHVSQMLDLGAKIEHEGQGLWTGCMAGDDDCWKRMEQYNKQDVVLLELLYKKLLPWIRVHPNHGLYDEPGIAVCPNCGSGNLQRRGHSRTVVGKYIRFQCRACGKWCREAISDLPKEDRQVILRSVND